MSGLYQRSVVTGNAAYPPEGHDKEELIVDGSDLSDIETDSSQRISLSDLSSDPTAPQGSADLAKEVADELLDELLSAEERTAKEEEDAAAKKFDSLRA